MKYHVYWLQKGSCFELFWGGKYSLFLSQKLMERLHLLITENFLYWTFRRGEIRSFFEPKTWWKYIYWLLKSSCSEFFKDGKYGFFWVKKLMEIWYLLITEEIMVWTFPRLEIGPFLSQKVDERWYLLGIFELSMIVQDLENVVFCAVQFLYYN